MYSIVCIVQWYLSIGVRLVPAKRHRTTYCVLCVMQCGNSQAVRWIMVFQRACRQVPESPDVRATYNSAYTQKNIYLLVSILYFREHTDTRVAVSSSVTAHMWVAVGTSDEMSYATRLESWQTIQVFEIRLDSPMSSRKSRWQDFCRMFGVFCLGPVLTCFINRWQLLKRHSLWII